MNVLIIEDDPMVDFIHRNYLEKTALFDSIMSSNSMASAQNILTTYAIDLILLDIHIIDGNGISFLEPYVPSIILAKSLLSLLRTMVIVSEMGFIWVLLITLSSPLPSSDLKKAFDNLLPIENNWLTRNWSKLKLIN